MQLLRFLDVLLVSIIIVVGAQLVRERAMRKRTSFTGKWPVKPVLPEAIDPVFHPGPLGPGADTEIAFLGRGPYVVDGGTSDAEAWILAVLAKHASQMFEFGTCTGKTAYLWARNAPDDAHIVTLTLAPDGAGEYHAGNGDDAKDVAYAMRESSHTSFVYSGTTVAHKVEQLYGDSKALDTAPWAGTCDVVFVDGSHAYSYVKSDSEKALELVKPGGLVLWHDYAGPQHSPGVYRAVNELAKRLPLVRIQGTALAAYRSPLH
ncbi:MAG: class I SAM-dependent methyltransferase [Gemmatimonadaceae bacterium]